MIKVLITDDHKLIREGIQIMLENAGDIEVVGSLASGEEAVNAVRENRPDVILMDILMNGMSGIESARWIKELDATIKILVVTMEISKDYVAAAIKAGVEGYLPKDVDKETLVEAIRKIYGGERYFNEAIMKLVFEDFYFQAKLKSSGKKLPDELTARENEVLGHVASGKTNREIADALFISVKTVETHKAHILEKLGLRNAAELTKYAIKNRIIPG